MFFKNLAEKFMKLGLVRQVIIGLVLGIILGFACPEKLSFISIFGDLFVKALKGIAPVLVFFVVMAAICRQRKGQKTHMKSIIVLYLLGTFLAGTTAVILSFVFKLQLVLPEAVEGSSSIPGNIGDVVRNLLFSVVANPVEALTNANYLGILTWAVVLGMAFRVASDTTKSFIADASDAVSNVVRWAIRFAPLGVMGLVYSSIATTGFDGLKSYGSIILLLVGTMLFDALVINPIIVYVCIRKNPYPLVFKCLKESGVTAFFTRSSAANVPVNMALCEELGLDKDTYTISIPLGSTINMGGAAITISVLTLATAFTLGIQVDIPTAIILCIISALSACGASGVAGGSLMLIPLACSLFGIPGDIAMSVVGIGFIIGVIQDSCETAINSSTDVLFTAAAEFRARRINGK